MKKSLLVVSCLGLSAMALASCGGKTANTVSKAEFKEMYTTSAIGGINMLNVNTGVKRAKALTEAQEAKVLENIKFVDEFLNDSAIQSAEKELVEGDKYFGQFKMTYDLTVNKFDGNKDVYRFYYSEEITEQDKEEVESKLNGIVVLNEGKEDEQAFKVLGEKEIEQEENEKGFEISFTISDEKDPTKRVVIEQENEQEGNEQEVEYKYSKYENNKVVESFKLEIENENNETEYVVSRLTGEDKSKYSYEVKDVNGEKHIEVKIMENNQVIKAEVKQTANGYEIVK